MAKAFKLIEQQKADNTAEFMALLTKREDEPISRIASKIQLLLNKPMDYSWKSDDTGDNVLHLAVRHFQYDFILKIVRVAPELLQRKNKEGQTPLDLFVKPVDAVSGSVEALRYDNIKTAFDLAIKSVAFTPEGSGTRSLAIDTEHKARELPDKAKSCSKPRSYSDPFPLGQSELYTLSRLSIESLGKNVIFHYMPKSILKGSDPFQAIDEVDTVPLEIENDDIEPLG